MSVNGDGEWKKTNFSNFWDAKIIWTTLSNFGGTDGMRGDLERINTIPFDGPANVWVRVCIFVCLFINRVQGTHTHIHTHRVRDSHQKESIRIQFILISCSRRIGETIQ